MGSSYSGPERRRMSCEFIGDCGVGKMEGELGIIKELLSDHIDQSRKERAEMKEEITNFKMDVKDDFNKVNGELTRYKTLFKAVIGTVICILTFEFGDISSLWSKL